MSSRGVLAGAVDGFGELSLQAPEGFVAAVAGVASALVVVASGAGADGLGVGGEVDGVVELAVAVSGQSVAHDFAAAGFDGRGACVAGEAVGAGEAADVADVAEDLGGEHVADPGELGQGGAAGGDGGCAASTVLREGAVEAAHVDEEVSGHVLALGLDAVAGTDLSEQGGGGLGVELGWRSAGDQVAQMSVRPVDRLAPFAGQLVAAVRQQPQHATVIIRGDAGQIGALSGDERDRAGVDAVGLGAVSRLEGPHPRREGRGHVDDMLAGGDELLGQQLAQAAGAFYAPAALGPLRRPNQQLLRCRAGCSQSDRGGLDAPGTDRGRGVGSLVRVDADDHSHRSLLCGVVRLRGSAAGNLNSGNECTPLSSHAAAGGDRPGTL